MGLRQISCSFKSPSTETSVSYSCHSRYSCSLNLSSNRANRPYSIRAIRVPLTYTSSRDNRPYSCDSRYSCSLNHSSYRVPRTHSLSFALLLPVSQWVYDKSRVLLSLRRQRPRSLIRAIRNIRVPLNTQAAEPHGLRV